MNSCSCSLYVVVRPSVCLSSVTFVHPTQAIEITTFRGICVLFDAAVCTGMVDVGYSVHSGVNADLLLYWYCAMLSKNNEKD